VGHEARRPALARRRPARHDRRAAGRSFEDKMRAARERRERGNRLFGKRYFHEADQEYEQALRFLVFMPHATPQQAPHIAADISAVQLNLAATKLRCGYEDAAIKHATKVLEMCPEHTKALYRIGQAYTQLGEYAKAREHLQRAEAAPTADDAVRAAVAKEMARLQERKERHARQRKRAFAKMVTTPDAPPASARASVAALASAWARPLLAGLFALAVVVWAVLARGVRAVLSARADEL
jgi:tetratricopeptide (TPR) repeat protein